MQVKVLTYNIHKGFSALNREYVLERLRAAMRETDVDCVFLQEVCGAQDEGRRSADDRPTAPQFEYLADSVWPHYAYARNAVSPRGHHGNVILSKFPIVRYENENLSTNRFEHRGLLHCEVEVPAAEGASGRGAALHLICVHLGLTERGRRSQIEHIRGYVRRRVPAGAPLVLAGDFNDWRARASAALNRGTDMTEVYKAVHGSYARTYPAALPLLPVDRIYARDLTVKAARRLVGDRWRRLSDHVPLTATFALDV